MNLTLGQASTSPEMVRCVGSLQKNTRNGGFSYLDPLNRTGIFIRTCYMNGDFFMVNMYRYIKYFAASLSV